MSTTIQLEQTATEPMLLGNSAPMHALRTLVRRVAGTDSTVLIQGESGTGKELVARLLHGWAQRTGKPFVAVNFGAIPGELMESDEITSDDKAALLYRNAERFYKFD